MRILRRFLSLVRTHWMLSASALVAVISMIIVPPDEMYLGYFDWKTIGCLFCVLAVACALRNACVFDWIARAIIERFEGGLALTFALVMTTALFSMAFTNDVALVIMLPLSVAVFVRIDMPQLIPVTFALQALTANLCGMITPFGNPQNLYLFTYYHIAFDEFACVMLLPFGLSVVGIVIATVMLTRLAMREKSSDMAHAEVGKETGALMGVDSSAVLVGRRRLVLYIPLFILTLLAVFRLIPVWVAVVVVLVVLVILDRSALLKVDYPLLLTFLCFFVFAGNMARVPVLEELLSPIMSTWGLLASALTSQVISNVPAAVLLSHFTQAWQPLLMGVNIGGAGTFVGSLASLIVIRHFMIAREMIPRLRKPDAPSTGAFLRLFGSVNAVFFVVLVVICQLVSKAILGW